MLALISPAKKLDFSPLTEPLPHSQGDFLDDTQELMETARTLSRQDLRRLMKLSDALADLNYRRFQDFSPPFDTTNAKQAALAFAGDTYIGLDARSLSPDELNYAQDHLRILSGLYGLLRPLDLIQPYRLEMGTKLPTPRGADLYDFWAGLLSEKINALCARHGHRAVVNLASVEYFKAIGPLRKTGLDARLITPVFKEIRNGEARVISLLAKRARGAMARHIITRRPADPEELKTFNAGGYAFQPHASEGDTWVFTRES
ncbi:peroxide stress protein YaaA [Varunaivibrio sulfuroxidans]|uniref:UPF0246 protein EDD55_108167 n=1 Tax=Varunaivibrio sulfuroxidans TaxID=1773489 RepID=A0A4R3J7M3_9PROT|nr:peroxide stress protein YaaA [Varunaivibrio sulfuroxidans]TCS61365.1 hypothetical protein EDD55_108167 [Varunaivibrio sulfuroxidans]WES31023.1 peroxide stress protein YaaA [Varunaivibrio sulfuroxidans]